MGGFVGVLCCAPWSGKEAGWNGQCVGWFWGEEHGGRARWGKPGLLLLVTLVGARKGCRLLWCCCRGSHGGDLMQAMEERGLQLGCWNRGREPRVTAWTGITTEQGGGHARWKRKPGEVGAGHDGKGIRG